MSDNVNTNGDVIINAEFIPKTIIAQKELPDVTIADAGKVATVGNDGKWTADNVPTELPAVTSADEGNVLIVDNEGNWTKGIPVPYSTSFYTIPVVDKDGVIHPLIPMIGIVFTTKITVDNDGYYEGDGYIVSYKNTIGHTSTLTPSDFDNYIIGLNTNTYLYFSLNDGVKDISLRGDGSFRSPQILTSTEYRSLVAILETAVCIDNNSDSEEYKMYDASISFNSETEKWHIKFKLEHITAT